MDWVKVLIGVSIFDMETWAISILVCHFRKTILGRDASLLVGQDVSHFQIAALTSIFTRSST